MTGRLGLGMAALGRPAYITTGRAGDLPADRSPESMRRRASEMLDAATALGIGYVDVARGYGLAEDFLAGWLATAAGCTPSSPRPRSATSRVSSTGTRSTPACRATAPAKQPCNR